MHINPGPVNEQPPAIMHWADLFFICWASQEDNQDDNDANNDDDSDDDVRIDVFVDRNGQSPVNRFSGIFKITTVRSGIVFLGVFKIKRWSNVAAQKLTIRHQNVIL